jgi:hypothetical protein
VDIRPLIPLGWFLAGGLIFTLTLLRLNRRRRLDGDGERARRGAGHAMLGLQQFIQPSVEFIFQAENAEQKEEDDGDAIEHGSEEIIADLAMSLRHQRVDHEEVRRHLASAQRSGLDWRELFEQAVRAELTARPFRAPMLPPVWRVAPRQ